MVSSIKLELRKEDQVKPRCIYNQSFDIDLNLVIRSKIKIIPIQDKYHILKTITCMIHKAIIGKKKELGY